MENQNNNQRFLALGLPSGAFGLETGYRGEPYFCTPSGAEIIGWLGVDGIHFCFIPSLNSDMVFAVSPMPCSEHYVVPIARTFEEFLALLLFCKDASLLESISYVTETRFHESVKEIAEYSSSAEDSAVDTLRLDIGIEPSPNAYESVKSLQADFDYTLIPFTDEYFYLTGAARTV